MSRFFIAILNEKEREKRKKKGKVFWISLVSQWETRWNGRNVFKGVEKSLKHLLNGVHRGFRVYRLEERRGFNVRNIIFLKRFPSKFHDINPITMTSSYKNQKGVKILNNFSLENLTRHTEIHDLPSTGGES